MKWRYLDMFSGIGGFRLGFKWAGFQFEKVYFSDIDKYSNEVYGLRFPQSIFLGDIAKVVPEKLGRLDIVSAGFPCQDLSVAGKQKGIKGERSGLFDEIIRVCRVCRPRYIILENVANLLSKPEWIGYVLGRIAEIGYDAEWEIIRASDVGAPHRRARIWIVAYSDNNGRSGISRQTRQGEGGSQFRKHINGKSIENVADAKRNGKRSGLRKDRSGEIGRRRSSDVSGSRNIINAENVGDSCSMGRGGQPRRRNGQKSKNGYVGTPKTIGRNWAAEPNLGRVAHGIPSRMDRLKCLGNSIVPQIAQYIGECILNIERR